MKTIATTLGPLAVRHLAGMLALGFAALAALPMPAEAACLAGESAGSTSAVPAPNSHGLNLLSLCFVNGTSSRLVDLVFQTPALPEPVHTFVYLPSTYATSGSARYATLYLLHGGLPEDNALSWPHNNVASIVDSSNFKGIVVMPEGGKAGWYTDWQGADGKGRRPLWQTFHISDLVPWIDANLRTVASASSRAVAGASMGGYGALAYAGQYPNLFSAVGSFSGAANIQDTATQQLAIANLTTLFAGTAITMSEMPINGGSLDHLVSDVQLVFGPYSTWAQKNPSANPTAYSSFHVALYAGSGSATNNGDLPYLPDNPADAGQWMEYVVRADNAKLHSALKSSGIAHRYCAGAGFHDPVKWQADLVDFLQVITGSPAATCPNGWGAPRS